MVVQDAREQLSAALAELRQLAHGIHPAALAQGGLAVAVVWVGGPNRSGRAAY